MCLLLWLPWFDLFGWQKVTTIHPCDPALIANPSSKEAVQCFYKCHKEKDDIAFQRLLVHHAEYPEEPWIAYYLARCRWPALQSAAMYGRAGTLFARKGNLKMAFYARRTQFERLRRYNKSTQAENVLNQLFSLARQTQSLEHQLWTELYQILLLLDQDQNLTRAYTLLQAIEERTRLQSHPGTNPELMKQIMDTLFVAAYELGLYDEAEQHLKKHLQLLDKGLVLDKEALIYYRLAILKTVQSPTAQNIADAISRHEEALEVAGDELNKHFLAWNHLELGKLLDGETAQAHLEECIRITKAYIGSEMSVQLNQARAALALEILDQDPQRAKQLFEDSRPKKRCDWEAYGWEDRMAFLWKIYPPQEAFRACLDELKGIEKLRQKQDNNLGQENLFSVWAEAYTWLSGRLLLEKGPESDRSDLEKAFRLSEQMRARSLSDALDLFCPELTGAPTTAPSSNTLLSQVEASLQEGEALLSFQLNSWKSSYGRFGGGAWLFVSSPQGTRLYPMPGPTDLEGKVSLFNGLLKNRRGLESIPEASVVLYDKLLRPALAELPANTKRLIIVPDKPLHLLPFAALRENVQAPFLGTAFQLSIVPSVSLWLRLRESSPHVFPKHVLALADPLHSSPSSQSERTEWARFRGNLGRLPHARQEGKGATQRFQRSRLLVDAQATEASLKMPEVEAYAVIHLATHAVVNDAETNKAGLLLASGDGQDGLLWASEISDLELQGKLVILSACQSGSGRILRGEGPTSLARAFLKAGASTVVASLWDLRDDEAAILFDHFYQNLAAGHSVETSLSEAQQKCIEQGIPSTTWASLVIYGKSELAPFPNGAKAPSDLTPRLLFLFVFSLPLWVVIRKRRRA